jgi:hypothetical protein
MLGDCARHASRTASASGQPVIALAAAARGVPAPPGHGVAPLGTASVAMNVVRVSDGMATAALPLGPGVDLIPGTPAVATLALPPGGALGCPALISRPAAARSAEMVTDSTAPRQPGHVPRGCRRPGP